VVGLQDLGMGLYFTLELQWDPGPITHANLASHWWELGYECASNRVTGVLTCLFASHVSRIGWNLNKVYIKWISFAVNFYSLDMYVSFPRLPIKFSDTLKWLCHGKSLA